MDQASPQLSAHAVPPADVEADWLIVGTFEAEPLPASLADLDARLGGLLTRLRRSGDLTGKAGELGPPLGVTRLAAPGGPPRAPPRRAGPGTGGGGVGPPPGAPPAPPPRRVRPVGRGRPPAPARPTLHAAAAAAARHATTKGTSRLTFVMPDGVPA